MKSIIASYFAIAAFGILPVWGQAPDVNTSPEKVGWISGCWEMSNGATVTTERWGKSTSNLMLGTSQTVKNGKSVMFEFLRIGNNGHGLAYIAMPADSKAPTAFMASKMSETEVVFENLKHDFPQRIIYRREGSDSLFARIEGPGAEGKTKAIDFPMKRVKCE